MNPRIRRNLILAEANVALDNLAVQVPMSWRAEADVDALRRALETLENITSGWPLPEEEEDSEDEVDEFFAAQPLAADLDEDSDAFLAAQLGEEWEGRTPWDEDGALALLEAVRAAGGEE